MSKAEYGIIVRRIRENLHSHSFVVLFLQTKIDIRKIKNAFAEFGKYYDFCLLNILDDSIFLHFENESNNERSA